MKAISELKGDVERLDTDRPEVMGGVASREDTSKRALELCYPKIQEIGGFITISASSCLSVQFDSLRTHPASRFNSAP